MHLPRGVSEVTFFLPHRAYIAFKALDRCETQSFFLRSPLPTSDVLQQMWVDSSAEAASSFQGVWNPFLDALPRRIGFLRAGNFASSPRFAFQFSSKLLN